MKGPSCILRIKSEKCLYVKGVSVSGEEPICGKMWLCPLSPSTMPSAESSRRWGTSRGALGARSEEAGVAVCPVWCAPLWQGLDRYCQGLKFLVGQSALLPTTHICSSHVLSCDCCVYVAIQKRQFWDPTPGQSTRMSWMWPYHLSGRLSQSLSVRFP